MSTNITAALEQPYPSLTAPQVADRLGISAATLYRLLARGEGPPSFRIGRRRLWREADIVTWLEEECRETGATG